MTFRSLFAIALFAASTFAVSTRTVSYQGILTDASGNARGDSVRTVTFRLYGAATGGSAVWSESLQVASKNGVFSANLGLTRSIAATVVPDSCWLGVAVGTGGVEMTPRQRINAAVYSVRSSLADSSAKAGRAGVADSALKLTGFRDSLGKKSDTTWVKTKLASISGGILVDGSVTGGKIASGAVDSNKIVDNSIVGADINTNAMLTIGGLVVKGNASIENSDARLDFYGNRGLNGYSSTMYMYDSQATTANKEVAYIRSGLSNGLSSGDLGLFTKEGNSWVQGIYMRNGNVGIGTTSPGINLKLDVRGSLGISTDALKTAIIQRSVAAQGSEGLAITAGSGYSADSTYFNPSDNNFGSGLVLASGNPATDNWGGGIQLFANGHLSPATGSIGNAVVFYNRIGPNSHKERMRIAGDGRVGIGIATPSSELQVCGTITANTALVTTVCSSSDRRFKQNITPLDSSLSKINSLTGVTYTWDSLSFPNRNFPSGTQIGLIAQDVEKVLPQIVHTDSEGYKSLSYDKITAVLIEAVKELKAQNETLKQRISALETKVKN